MKRSRKKETESEKRRGGRRRRRGSVCRILTSYKFDTLGTSFAINLNSLTDSLDAALKVFGFLRNTGFMAFEALHHRFPLMIDYYV